MPGAVAENKKDGCLSSLSVLWGRLLKNIAKTHRATFIAGGLKYLNWPAVCRHFVKRAVVRRPGHLGLWASVRGRSQMLPYKACIMHNQTLRLRASHPPLFRFWVFVLSPYPEQLL